MLFKKSIDPHCAYCAVGSPLEKDQILCPKKGVVLAGFACRHFRYDPFKRVPPPPVQPDFSKLKEEDFTL